MVRVLLGVGFFLIGISNAVALEASGSVEAGKIKSNVCTPCHNADGNSAVPAWPKIAGQSEKYLVEQLKEYRKGTGGTRHNPVMYGIVQALTDQDIADLAAYFESQKPSPGAAKEAGLSLGEKIYRGGNLKTGVPGCGPSCHGARGEGNIAAGFPALSGQHADYVIEQLKAFKSGARANGPNGIMRDIAKRMTEEEIQAVGNYVSGLH